MNDRRLIHKGEEKLGFRSFTLTALNSEMISAQANNWLSVLFGEDMFIVCEERQSHDPSLRGRLIYSNDCTQDFMEKAYNWTNKELINEWKAEVLNSAFGCFTMAIQGGLNYTPITQSLFVNCLENLANVRNFNPSKHRKSKQRLGPKSFFNPSEKGDTVFLADLDALIAIRNITGFHFGAHQERERTKLAKVLRNSFKIRGIYSPEFIDLSFHQDRIIGDIHREAWWLYLMALNLCREAFTRLIGAKSVLVAEKDLWPFVLNAEAAHYTDSNQSE